MKVIEFNNVRFLYSQGETILDGISFDVEQGEIVSLVGANGVGKSTIARLILGLINPTKGNVKVFGLDVNDQNIKTIRNKCGLVFQNPDNQFVGNIVADDIAFRLENANIKHEEMDEIINSKLHEVDMFEYKFHEPYLLSGGQKQRIAIASNIVLPLDLLVLDEATSMIDPKGKDDILNILLKIKKENPNMTIVMITHNMEETLISNRVIVLNESHIAYDGSPDNLFSNSEFLQRFSLKAPFKYQLYQELSNSKISVCADDSIEEMVNKLCQ